MQEMQEMWFDPWVQKIPRGGIGASTLVFLPGKLHGQRGLVCYSPKGHKELDMSEWSLHTHTHTHTIVMDNG